MVNDLLTSVGKAREWFLNTPSSLGKELRSLGILLCDSTLSGKLVDLCNDNKGFTFPEPFIILHMNRIELIKLMKDISLLNSEQIHLKKNERNIWSFIIDALIASYARTGDLEVVAILIRASTRLSLKIKYINEAMNFLLNHQNINGCFGLLGRENIELHGTQKEPFIFLRLTVEVIWTITEILINFLKDERTYYAR